MFDECEIGLDEAGRGALMGPIFAAAVLFHPKQIARWEENKDSCWAAIRDSKAFSKKNDAEISPQMETLSLWIKQNALFWAIGSRDVDAIQKENPLQATISTWHDCLSRFPFHSDANLITFRDIDVLFHDTNESKKLLDKTATLNPKLLVDGNQFRPFFLNTEKTVRVEYTCVVNGDALHKCISAASILAKVARDRHIVNVLAPQFPQYSWSKNKGYGTADHLAAIKEHGITPHHRVEFRGVREHVVYKDPRHECPR